MTIIAFSMVHQLKDSPNFSQFLGLGWKMARLVLQRDQYYFFPKLTNREVDEAKIQTCFSSKLVCNNEIMDVMNTIISKNHCIKRTSFHIHTYKFYKNKLNLLVVYEFRRYSKFSMARFEFFF